jgi:hypothetical protein
MSSLVTKSLNVLAAEQLYKAVAVEDNNTNIYLVIAKPTEWSNEAAPEVPLDHNKYRNEFWRNTIAGKKITANDIRLAVRRVDWVANTVYTQYTDDDVDLYDKDFYIITDEYKVFKCLYNNNGTPSTSKPTYTTPDAKSTEADGYIWKYMFTLPTADIVRFLTPDWIPIKTLEVDNGELQWEVQQAATYGAIDIINLVTAGNGYSNTLAVNVFVQGDGSDFSAIVTANAANGNSLSQIIVLSPGSDYTYANVTISGGGGMFATANAVISPYGGHGYDPVEELGASTIIISAKLNGAEANNFTIDNDFRQVALIKNPISSTTGLVMGNTYFTQSRDLSLVGSGSDYVPDEQVYQGGALANATYKAYVLDWNSTTNILRVVSEEGAPSAKKIQGIDSFAERFLLTSKVPDIIPGSGKFLYNESRTPVYRSPDQTEEFKIIIKI